MGRGNTFGKPFALPQGDLDKELDAEENELLILHQQLNAAQKEETWLS